MRPSESSPLIYSKSKSSDFPAELSFKWRIVHNILYLCGGVNFVIGSYQYYSSVANYTLGGWCFTIGSTGFFFADLFEWWKNNRVGCFSYASYENSYESQVRPFFESKDTLYGRIQRAEVGMNFFLSLIGSTLYLIGSALYIPQINESAVGDEIFIYGSSVIFIAQSWKLYRGACTCEEDRTNKSFNLMNLRHDISGACVDLLAGLGGFAYLIGSIIFLAVFDINNHRTHVGANWYVFGGWCYFFSGAFMFARYFLLGGYSFEWNKDLEIV